MNEAQSKLADALSCDRTRRAADRTPMEWVRTALSMIGFGFTIYKFLQSLENTALAAKRSSESIGLTLIGVGVFSLTIACPQQWKYVCKHHSQSRPPGIIGRE